MSTSTQLGPYIGIDFGTSRSTMAWFNPATGQAEVIRNAEGKDETPSIVYFGAGETLVGDPAEAMLFDTPDKRRQVVRSVKRDMVNQPRIALVSRRVTAIEVASTILAKLRRDAEEQHFHQPVRRAVVTCPAAFDEMQLDKIGEAARQAGFTEVALLPEPVAAALAYAQAGQQVGRHVLVYDLGGGTFDLALLARERGPEGTPSFRVALEPKGLVRCGGDDFDRALYDHCDEVAVSTLGRGITLSGETDLFFLRQCRVRKETLSAAERCGFSAYLQGEENPARFSYEMTRGAFEGLIAPTVEATVRLTGTLMQEARAANLPVETVVLIGGSSRVPLAQRRLQETLPVAPQKWQKQDVAVALGAALHGHLIWDIQAAARQAAAPGPAAQRPVAAPPPQPGPRGHPPVAGQAPPPMAPAGGMRGPEGTPNRPVTPAPGGAHPQAGSRIPPATAGQRPGPRGHPPPPLQPTPASGSPGQAPPGSAPQSPLGGPTGGQPHPEGAQRAPGPPWTPPVRVALAASPPPRVATPITPRGSPVAGPVGGFGPRLGAYLIDQILTWVVGSVLAIAALGGSSDAANNNGGLISGLVLLVQILYYGYFWSAGGRTLGYRVAGLQVTRRDGSPVPMGTAALRYLGYLLCGLPFGLGFLWMLWDPKRETWAEKISETTVVSTKGHPGDPR